MFRFLYSLGVIPCDSLKTLLKCGTSLNPTAKQISDTCFCECFRRRFLGIIHWKGVGTLLFSLCAGWCCVLLGGGEGFTWALKGYIKGWAWEWFGCWVIIGWLLGAIARLSPDHRRHFNRWETKITYSNNPSTKPITRLFTFKNNILGHYIPGKRLG